MTELSPDNGIVDELCHACLSSSDKMSWLVEPLTPGRAKAYILQHVLRNRLLSAVIRPAWVSRCPDMNVVRKTIEQMREELVIDDAVGRAHTDLLYQMGRNIGLSDYEMNSSRPQPMVDAAFHVWENLARSRHWISGWLASSVGEYLITTIPENNFHPEKWKQALGLTDEQVFFFSYHLKADLDHAGRDVWEPIKSHVLSNADRQEVLAGARQALEGLRLFYQGVSDFGDQLDRAH